MQRIGRGCTGDRELGQVGAYSSAQVLFECGQLVEVLPASKAGGDGMVRHLSAKGRFVECRPCRVSLCDDGDQSVPCGGCLGLGWGEFGELLDGVAAVGCGVVFEVLLKHT